MEERQPSGAFCVVCGKAGVELFDALCVDCFRERSPPIELPPRVRVVLCPFCGGREYGRHWEKGPPPGFFHSKDVEIHLKVNPPFILKSLTWEESGQNPKLRQFAGTATLELGGSSFEVLVNTELKVSHQTCPACTRRGGRYFTAKLQFRDTEEGNLHRSTADFRTDIQRYWGHFLAGAPRVWSEAIAWEEDLKEGIDVYFTDTTTAKSVAREIKSHSGARTKDSASLWGVKDGRQIYRTTVLLRFPALLPGDFFESQGKLKQLKRRLGDKLRILDIATGEQETLPTTETESGARIVAARDRVLRALVVPEDPSVVLHPVSGDKLRLRNPLSEEELREVEVSVIVDKGEAWWIPKHSLRKKGPSI